MQQLLISKKKKKICPRELGNTCETDFKISLFFVGKMHKKCNTDKQNKEIKMRAADVDVRMAVYRKRA